jgi:membrane protein implicated in regulation of membrane protease activity
VFELPTADQVFLICALIGGFLLLITVVLDDILGGALDFLDLDLGGSSLMPLILAFVAMFGIGGLFGTQVLELSSGMASIVGVGFGTVGAALAWAMFRFLRNSVSPPPFSQQDLVGTDAYVTVAIPKTAWGTISLEVEGQMHEFRATSSVDIPRGETVRISGVAGTGLIVEHRSVPTDQVEVATETSAEGVED